MEPEEFFINPSDRESIQAIAREYSRVAFQPTSETSEEVNLEDIKQTMKKRHLDRDERQLLHKPDTDWVATKRGDKCRNSVTLEIEDIVRKYDGTKQVA